MRLNSSPVMSTLDFRSKSDVTKTFPTLLLAQPAYYGRYTLHALWKLTCTNRSTWPLWIKEHLACVLCALMFCIPYQSYPVCFPECLHRSAAMSREKDPLFHKAVPLWNGNKQYTVFEVHSWAVLISFLIKITLNLWSFLQHATFPLQHQSA